MTSELELYMLCDEVNRHNIVTTLPGNDDVSIPGLRYRSTQSSSTQQGPGHLLTATCINSLHHPFPVERQSVRPTLVKVPQCPPARSTQLQACKLQPLCPSMPLLSASPSARRHKLVKCWLHKARVLVDDPRHITAPVLNIPLYTACKPHIIVCMSS